MSPERSLQLEYIKELSQIWYELEVLEEEPLEMEEKFYDLIERIFDAMKARRIEEDDTEVPKEIWETRNRSALLEHLNQMFRFDPELVTLLQKQCTELVRTKA